MIAIVFGAYLIQEKKEEITLKVVSIKIEKNPFDKKLQ